ncbi:VanW family protein [Thermoflavimicrobium daqui]|uniref:YoaR-like putative peptidoglycan binding domain-containing protein n=1 Tax=Thermoflavimicrobium daqui TaxID=2137476 RepID=A0A364K4Q5_9BACL|nr:VanW family protein [Thermoflavimicrobium daqui]RAL24342.1 hypothetical protein DL897_08425 [Thermoflavimicrobium daqui]
MEDKKKNMLGEENLPDQEEQEKASEEDVGLEGFAFNEDAPDSSSQEEMKDKEDSDDSISLFDHWGTDAAEESDTEEKDESAKSEKEVADTSTSVEEAAAKEEQDSNEEISIFDEWGTSEQEDQSEVEEVKEEQENAESKDETSRADVEKDEDSNEVLFATLEEETEDKQELTAEMSSEEKEVQAKHEPEESIEKKDEEPKASEENKSLNDVAFFDRPFEVSDKEKPIFDEQKDVSSGFKPSIEEDIKVKLPDPTPPVKPPISITEERPSFLQRSKKWIIGLAASLVLIGGGAFGFSKFSKTEYYLQEVQPLFKGYNVQLTAGQKKYDLDLKKIGFDGENYATIDKKQLAAWLDGIRKELDRPAVNATFKDKKANTGINPDKTGSLVDTKQVADWFKEGNIKKLYNRPKEIPMVEDKPALTVADLKNMNKKLGTYDTVLGGSTGARVKNIRIASNTIDDFVLKPGQTFSWNGYVGDTTADKGYLPAGVIVNGKMATGYGGGICQVSTTLYQAVKNKLTIVERRPHSKPVGYVPLGEDATIAYDYTDLKFANPYDKPVLIKADASGPDVVVSVYTIPGAKKLTKDELAELNSQKVKTESFTKLLLGYDPLEEKIKQDMKKKGKNKHEDDMMDVPMDPQKSDDANSL